LVDHDDDDELEAAAASSSDSDSRGGLPLLFKLLPLPPRLPWPLRPALLSITMKGGVGADTAGKYARFLFFSLDVTDGRTYVGSSSSSNSNSGRRQWSGAGCQDGSTESAKEGAVDPRKQTLPRV